MRIARSHVGPLLLSLALLAAGCRSPGAVTDDAVFPEPEQTNLEAEDQAVTLDRPDLPEGSTAADIQAEGELVVGVRFDVPLFGLVNPETGLTEGFDVEIARIVAASIFGAPLEENLGLVLAEPGNREELVDNGTVDMVVATYAIPDDTVDSNIAFAGPYYRVEQGLLVAAGSQVSGVDDLAGQRVCTVADSEFLDNVREQAPEADLSVLFPDPRDCAEALLAGEVDAVTHDAAVLRFLAQESEGELEVTGQPFAEESFGIAVPEADAEWREFINQVLLQAFSSGAWQEAYEETFGVVGLDEAPLPPDLRIS